MCRVQSRGGPWEPPKCSEGMREGDQTRLVSLEGHSGSYLKSGLEGQGEMLTCRSQGDPRGTGWGKVETGGWGLGLGTPQGSDRHR